VKKYEIGKHTADLELWIWGKDTKELFKNAARGMTDQICPSPLPGQAVEKNIRLSASNIEELLILWLNEILFFFEVEDVVFRKLDIHRLSGTELEAVCSGMKVDWRKSQAGSEIKAATYHDLFIKKIPGGWQAHVIFDL